MIKVGNFGLMFLAAVTALTKSMCWKVVAKTVDSSGIGLVIYQKPISPSCYEKRKENNLPLCEQKDWKNSSWYFSKTYLSIELIPHLLLLLVVVVVARVMCLLQKMWQLKICASIYDSYSTQNISAVHQRCLMG